MIVQFHISWRIGPGQGHIAVTNGEIAHLAIVQGSGSCEGERFFAAEEAFRLEVAVRLIPSDAKDVPVVTVDTDRPFSFFLRDVNDVQPIFIPAYEVAVLVPEDQRSYEQIGTDIAERKLVSDYRMMESEPEESFENAAIHTRELKSETWLGVSRDMRIFEVGFRGIGAETVEERLWDWIQPRFHGHEATLPENEGKPVSYRYMIGRGIGCTTGVTRRLEDGCLPILYTEIADNDIRYHVTSFVSYEKSPLNRTTLKGTHYLIADGFGHGHMFTEGQAAERELLLSDEGDDEEETVLYSRVIAANKAKVPRYAWFKNVIPNAYVLNNDQSYTFDGQTGFVQYSEERVCCVSKLNGNALTNEETAILLMPGQTAIFEFYLPHRPISRLRAEGLMAQCFEARLEECRDFWRDKLNGAASVKLPEKRLEEMLNAGLLHLDLVAYGTEPAGTIVPTIGVYTAIGSESSPIVQFMDAMGWSRTAERALQFFLEKQHENGFIQNFGGYMLETGAALWSFGEHYRYTRDEDWLVRVKPGLLKAYHYLVEWRNRNKRDDLAGKGYGMLEGKTADPEDPFHSFMLSGYAYLGMSRLAEMMTSIDPAISDEIRTEAEALKTDIREALFATMARSPVVPLSDGSWVPTVPPWVEHKGPLSLYAEGGKWLTHGSVVARDSLLGPLYLVLQEVVQPDEMIAEFMLNVHHEFMCSRNVALSQPYYSIHPWIHLKRGEVKPFLKAYYNTFAALADRETYTFWEHFWHASSHKTHEEAWFLMQTRWMLYMEEGRELKLLTGIPRNWLKDGGVIEIKGAATYFGPLTLHVEARAGGRVIVAKVVCDSARRPESLSVRLPHPNSIQPVAVSGGRYLATDECVRVDAFEGSAEITLTF
ncbi:hypothetical protein [Cohnella soli]|uniref:Uncharacterized protein n=1 Tax=Cohnella soli TaxID=425005 RepID=A0ABW0HWZ6_9BACL